MDTFNFPYYAYYRGNSSKVFKNGDIIKLLSFRNLSGPLYSPVSYKSGLFRSISGLDEGYAEYSTLNDTYHEPVHISELEVYNG